MKKTTAFLRLAGFTPAPIAGLGPLFRRGAFYAELSSDSLFIYELREGHFDDAAALADPEGKSALALTCFLHAAGALSFEELEAVLLANDEAVRELVAPAAPIVPCDRGDIAITYFLTPTLIRSN